MVFDTAEHLVPVVMAILRAESVWEIPVLGKLLAAGAEKRMLAAQRETEEFIAASFGRWTWTDDLPRRLSTRPRAQDATGPTPNGADSHRHGHGPDGHGHRDET